MHSRLLQNRKNKENTSNDVCEKLSPYATTFYYEWLTHPQATRYNMVFDQTLYGHLIPKRLHQALHQYVADHVILNSHIEVIKNIPCWVPNEAVKSLDIVPHPIDEDSLLAYVAASFDLHQGPLYRFYLLCLDKNRYRFICVFHHIVIDGASTNSGVFDAITNYYNDKHYHITENIITQSKQLQKFTTLYKQHLATHKIEYTRFWQQQASVAKPVDLLFLQNKMASDDQLIAREQCRVNEITFYFSGEMLKKLNAIKYQHRITPYLYGFCIFAILLYRYTNQSNFAICHPIAIKEGRNFYYGAQVNVNYVPFQITQITTVTALFKQITCFIKQTLKGKQCGYYPIDDIFAQGADQSLLNVTYCAANMRNKAFAFDGITKVKISKTTTIDGVKEGRLLLEQELENDKLNYRLRYRGHDFDEVLLNDFVRSYQDLFTAILNDLSRNNIDKRVVDYALLTPEEIQKVDTLLNPYYPLKKSIYSDTLHHRFEQHAIATPDKIAVKSGSTPLTYQMLNVKANQLANYLRTVHSIKPNNIIALYIERSLETLISILAVLKVGLDMCR